MNPTSPAIRDPSDEPLARRVGRWALALLFILAGMNHFLNPDFYVRIMPPYLPFHRELVWISGVFEILAGAGLLVDRWRSAAGWGVILLLLAVFPANLHMALNPDDFDFPAWALYLRLPLQAVFIAWAWWASRSSTNPRHLQEKHP